MSIDWSKHRVLITGGANGIGLALAKACMARGARIHIADIDDEALKRARDTLHIDAEHAHRLDVSDHGDVSALEAEFREQGIAISAVFNNAGIGVAKPFLKTKPEDFDWTFGVNIRGVWSVARVFAEHMVRNETSGLIVNTASEHALGVPHLNNGIYTASKHAVLGLSDVMRDELAPLGIQVAVLCPGLTQSEIWRGAERRPDAFGGRRAAPDGAHRVQDKGIPAADVARIALDGLDAGRFYLITHKHNAVMVEERHSEMSDALNAVEGESQEGQDVNDVLIELYGEGVIPRPSWQSKG